MINIMKKIKIIGWVIIALLVIVVLVWRFLPAKYAQDFLGTDSALSSVACAYPVKVAGDSLAPYLNEGETKLFDKCFSVDDLQPETIIAWQDEAAVRLGIISKINKLDSEMVYEVVQPNRPDRVNVVTFSAIVAFYHQDSAPEGDMSTNATSGQAQPIIMSDYSFVLPAGWQAEELTDEQALFRDRSAISISGFQTYLAIRKDNLQGRALAACVDDLQEQIAQAAPGIIFENEANLEIAGQESFAMEGRVTQNNLDFRILTVVIVGREGVVWYLNFNTLQEQWSENALVFETMVKSFQFK